MTGTASALTAAWTVAVAAGAWRHRPHRLPGRIRSLTPLPPLLPRTAAEGPAGPVARTLSRATGRPVDPVVVARVGRPLLAALAVLPVLPLASPFVAAGVWGLPALRARRRRRQRDASVVRQLPEVVDLFALAAGAGLTVPLALAAVARRSSGVVADELVRAEREVDLGRRLGDALEGVAARLGDPARPLVSALVASERYGAPLLDRLERLAAEVRAERRRRAEDAARRVPVKLLFPLVFCTLPAFALLTVAPLVAGALPALRLSAS